MIIYKMHFNYLEEVKVTLAVDTISLTPSDKQDVKSSIRSLAHEIDKQYAFSKQHMTDEQRIEFEKSEKTAYYAINNGFIFYLEPHDPSLPCIPIHISLKHGGSMPHLFMSISVF